MACPSEDLERMAGELFPRLKKELSEVQDVILMANNRLKAIPPSLLHNGAQEALKSCREHLDLAQAHTVSALKSIHQQFPH
jgi:hypothetical protein|tara:strand:- start:509 stop:751 length:243 start_codon:yes stop_codon:yes gene_type:complete